MENTKKNVPEIRFPGFTDPWEQRKLGDIADVTKLAGFEFTEHVVYSDTGNIIALRGLNVKNGQLVLDDVKYIDGSNLSKLSRSKLYANDIMFTYVGTVGEVAIINENDRFYLAPNVSRIRVQSNDSPRYISHYMRSEMFYRTVIFPLIATSSQPALSMENIRKFTIAFPAKTDEQVKIAAFFDQIDNLITLHQRKCDELKIYKKGLLQQMFPLPGEAFPRVRFPGFTNPWEQRKFDEITFPASIRNKDNLPLEPYSITNDRGFLPQNEAHDDFGYMQNTDRKAYMVVSPNSFGYNPARINVGSIGYYEGSENVIVSSLYEIFKTQDYIDDHFLMHWFKSDLFPRWIEKFQEGSVRQYFYYDKLCECSLTFPSIEEQRKISSLIDLIDTTITLHQRKCDELKIYKKGLLQKMFV